MTKRTMTWTLPWVACLWLAAGCSNDSGAAGEDATVGGEAQDASPLLDTGPVDGGTADDTGAGDSGSSAGADGGGAADDAGGAGPDAGAECPGGCPSWAVCVAGSCESKPCAEDAECNPEGGATGQPYYCYRGQCAAFQCSDDTDCDASEACNTTTFLCYAVASGCTSAGQCVDTNPCTVDTCEDGACVHTLEPGCCAEDADCDDNIPCTADSCAFGKCAHEQPEGCCVADAECADSDACTTDVCKAGVCTFEAIEACCKGDGMCDDGDDASIDVCHQGGCIHTYAGAVDACSVDSDCSANGCLSGVCTGGQCDYTAKAAASGCCTTDAQCAADEACMVESCQALVCVSEPVSGQGEHAFFHFDGGLDGWAVEPGGNQTSVWHASTLKSVEGGGALRYGVPGQQSFAAGKDNKGAIVSPKLTLPAQAALSFWVYFDGEPAAGLHQFGLELIEPGKAPVSVWSKNDDLKGNTQQQWKAQNVSLQAWSGKADVQLRWWFDVKDSVNDNKIGLLVDEMTVLGTCP
jgi:hypothetical protein